jgi:hypothetical protein
MDKELRDAEIGIIRGFAYIAFWQGLVFLMLLLLVWANEILDLRAILFNASPRPPDLTRGCIASAGVFLAAIIVVGNTYLQQRRIIRGLLTICCYCHKIRVDRDAWERVEEYIGKYNMVEFSHGICPDCHGKLLDKMQKDKSAAPG